MWEKNNDLKTKIASHNNINSDNNQMSDNNLKSIYDAK